MRVLLVENIHQIAQTNLEQKGFEVETLSSAPSENQLIEKP